MTPGLTNLLGARKNIHYMKFKEIQTKRKLRSLKGKYRMQRAEIGKLKKEGEIREIEYKKKIEELTKKEQQEKTGIIDKEHKVSQAFVKEEEKIILGREQTKQSHLKPATVQQIVHRTAFEKQIDQANLFRGKVSLDNLAQAIAKRQINPAVARQTISKLGAEEKRILEADYDRIMEKSIGRRIGGGIRLGPRQKEFLKRASGEERAAIRWIAETERLAEKAARKGVKNFNKHEVMLYNRVMGNPKNKKMFENLYRELMEKY